MDRNGDVHATAKPSAKSMESLESASQLCIWRELTLQSVGIA